MIIVQRYSQGFAASLVRSRRDMKQDCDMNQTIRP